MPSDISSVTVVSCDTGTEAAVADQAAKCDDDDENRSTSGVADSLPAATTPEVDDSPSHLSTDTDHKPSPAEETPATSSEHASTDNSPTHSDNAEANSDSMVSLPTDAETSSSSAVSVAAGD